MTEGRADAQHEGNPVVSHSCSHRFGHRPRRRVAGIGAIGAGRRAVPGADPDHPRRSHQGARRAIRHDRCQSRRQPDRGRAPDARGAGGRQPEGRDRHRRPAGLRQARHQQGRAPQHRGIWRRRPEDRRQPGRERRRAGPRCSTPTRTARSAATNSSAGRWPAFDKLDTNKDGTVTPEERSKAVAAAGR